MKLFRITLQHDKGRTTIGVYARTKRVAISAIRKTKRCPESAIIKVERM